MATCAILGQAAGTAAALCVKHTRAPRDLSSGAPLRELQATVMEDDCWLPTLRREISQLARNGFLSAQGDNAAALLDGLDRDRKGENHAWSGPQGANIDFQWTERVKIDGARIVFDSNLNFDKCMPCSYPRAAEHRKMPASLVKAFRLECLDNSGKWQTVFREEKNCQRLVYVPLAVESTGLRLVAEETWGASDARVFAFEPLAPYSTKVPSVPEGETFAKVRSKISPQDLLPPAGISLG